MQNQQCSSTAEKRKGTEKRRASGGGPELDLKERLRKKQAVGSVAHGQALNATVWWQKPCVWACAFVPVEGVVSPGCAVRPKELRRPSAQVAVPLRPRVLASPLAFPFNSLTFSEHLLCARC